jgi:predicted DCC family thiol-disulfide oxidoreductase YuxK
MDAPLLPTARYLYTGARAFVLIWSELPYWKALAVLSKFPLFVPIMEQVYSYWAVRRMKITGRD